MNKDEIFYVISFDSTHHAIKAEKLLKEQNLSIKMMPTPREITASCGLSIRFESENLLEVEDIINKEKLAVKGKYKMERKDGLRTAEKID